jgi:hypothetical protein
VYNVFNRLITERMGLLKIAIIDADLVQNIKTHRFPNLACMKLSGYYKDRGHHVVLKLDYDGIGEFDKVFVSKVFSSTNVPEGILNLKNVEYGGTGFFYDESPSLPFDIEHSFPDYDLYRDWVEDRMSAGDKRKSMEYYLDYSIGFTTRGCIRGCSFCVNRNSKKAVIHSNVDEFIDNDKPYICLLDDNVLACSDWKKIFESLIKTNKRFQYKQGMDERLLTVEKCDYIFNKSKWKGDYIFAFDNIDDSDIIIKKLKLIRENTNKKNIKFYVFTGYNHDKIGDYNEDFYAKDIESLLKRIKILSDYKCFPYVMRFIDVYNFPYPFKNIYTTIAGWCNQPMFYVSMTLKEFSVAKGMKANMWKEYVNKPDEYKFKQGVSWRAADAFLNSFPEFNKYYNFKGQAMKPANK